MEILVTGAAGFLGSHLCDALLLEGHSITGLDNLAGGYASNVPSGVRFIRGDCNQPESYIRLLDGVEVFVHCAAAAYEGLSVFSPGRIFRDTCLSTVSLASAAAHLGAGKFVLMSSMARYGNQPAPFTEDMQALPVDPYGVAKVSAEMSVRVLAEAHDMRWSIAVPHNIIGTRQKYDDPFRNVASIMINRMLSGRQPVIYGDGSQMRCFSHVGDSIQSIKKMVLADSADGEVVNVGPDEEPISILDLARLIAEIVNFDLDPIFVEARPLEVPVALCSSDKARSLLGYRTETPLKQSLIEMVEWIDRRGTLPFDYHMPIEIDSHRIPSTWSEKLI
ncbi:NAD-dependent epimerase/dehydratase family protein [Streptomyces sp. NPDC048357]|uniref:NAD-dependent epimerase/dehydratase family protein n=1 Tax=Streptomyces sp. NPDC048357 TaxID=3154719 RepID=UPI00341DEEFE